MLPAFVFQLHIVVSLTCTALRTASVKKFCSINHNYVNIISVHISSLAWFMKKYVRQIYFFIKILTYVTLDSYFFDCGNHCRIFWLCRNSSKCCRDSKDFVFHFLSTVYYFIDLWKKKYRISLMTENFYNVPYKSLWGTFVFTVECWHWRRSVRRNNADLI